MIATERTIDALEARGWAKRDVNLHRTLAGSWSRAVRRTAYVTRAGLIAAGVDMDALHAEAAAESEAREILDGDQSAAAWLFADALLGANDRQAALDVLHAEALDDDDARYVAEGRELLGWGRPPAEAKQAECLTLDCEDCGAPKAENPSSIFGDDRCADCRDKADKK